MAELDPLMYRYTERNEFHLKITTSINGIREVSFTNLGDGGGRWICPFLGVFKLIPVNFPGLVASSHAKGPVLILAIKALLLMLVHQIKES